MTPRGSAPAGPGVGVSTPWSRWLERLILVVPVLVGAGVVGLLAGAPVPELQRVVLLGVALAAVVVRLGVPICLFGDARALARGRLAWRPNRWLYPGGALLVSAPLVGLGYLYRRYQRIPPTVVGSHWWLVVALAAVVPVSTVLVGLLGTPFGAGTILAAAATVAAGLLPVGIFRDAAYVRRQDYRWNPNPAFYLALAFGCLLVTVLQPVLAVWYLGKRHRARAQAA